MRLRRPQIQRGWAVNIAPLIDVVFLLIIFSMMVSHFSRVQVEALALPEAAQGEAAPPDRPPPVVVNVLKDGSVVLGGIAHSADALRAALASERAARPAGDLEVVVRGDRATDWAHVARVMSACAAEGIGQVRVAVVEAQAAEGP